MVLMLLLQLVYFFYPETANLTLEEIDYLFVSGDVAAERGQAQGNTSAASTSSKGTEIREDGFKE